MLRASVKSTELDMGVSGTNARVNHFCCLQQCSTPQEYARRLRALGEYHSRDIHEWDGVSVDFTPKLYVPVRNVKKMKNCNVRGNPTRRKTPLPVTTTGCNIALSVSAAQKMQIA